MPNLVIVESPAKAGTIKSYLGSNYRVIASKGHIRDLPKSTLGIDIENDFEPHYINIRGKGDVIRELKKEAKAANKIFLATDPDREGEAISWHLAITLGIPLDRICRVSFNEITKSAIKDAIKHPRTIDENLVNSQQARRILDRIVGYKLSPFLWKNVKSGLSAGRVQSVATRIIVERENEIRKFVPSEYWTIEADLLSPAGDNVRAKFYGDISKKQKITNVDQTNVICEKIHGKNFTVYNTHESQKQKQPMPPFITSTLQQEASRKLGFQTQRIMKVAQELYEGINLGSEFGGVHGLITYMRTDSLRISASAQEAARNLIREEYGESYVPKTARQYKSRSGAQDAHEAIRPADVKILPSAIKNKLTNDQYKIYKLIWERFVASQMSSAIINTVTVDFECSGYIFKSSCYSVKFQGYMALYQEQDDTNEDEAARLSMLPEVKTGELFACKNIDKQQHFTEPPARYTEASLIKFLEENGVGRPSTYAPIVTTIIARNYVKRDGKSLVPTPLGEVTTELMKQYFSDIVDYEFTASMEDKLDSIENGDTTIKQILGEFYEGFAASLENADTEVSKSIVEVPDEESDVICEKCGKKMVYKNGRFGKFLACPGYPECKNTKAVQKDGSPIAKVEKKVEIADFKCDKCGGDMVLRSSRYGAFYACANYPTCKFTKPKTTDVGVACPECGARIISKRSKGKSVFYSCEEYPECQFSSWDLPTNEKCPNCNKMLFIRKNKKIIVCHDKNCGYVREESKANNENN